MKNYQPQAPDWWRSQRRKERRRVRARQRAVQKSRQRKGAAVRRGILGTLSFTEKITTRLMVVFLLIVIFAIAVVVFVGILVSLFK